MSTDTLATVAFILLGLGASMVSHSYLSEWYEKHERRKTRRRRGVKKYDR